MPEEQVKERNWREFNPVELSEETHRIAQRCSCVEQINAELLRRFAYPFHVSATFDEEGHFVEGKMWSKLGRSIHY